MICYRVPIQLFLDAFFAMVTWIKPNTNLKSEINTFSTVLVELIIYTYFSQSILSNMLVNLNWYELIINISCKFPPVLVKFLKPIVSMWIANFTFWCVMYSFALVPVLYGPVRCKCLTLWNIGHKTSLELLSIYFYCLPCFIREDIRSKHYAVVSLFLYFLEFKGLLLLFFYFLKCKWENSSSIL